MNKATQISISTVIHVTMRHTIDTVKDKSHNRLCFRHKRRQTVLSKRIRKTVVSLEFINLLFHLNS
jgi:hypothetical protein